MKSCELTQKYRSKKHSQIVVYSCYSSQRIESFVQVYNCISFVFIVTNMQIFVCNVFLFPFVWLCISFTRFVLFGILYSCAHSSSKFYRYKFLKNNLFIVLEQLFIIKIHLFQESTCLLRLGNKTENCYGFIRLLSRSKFYSKNN